MTISAEDFGVLPSNSAAANDTAIASLWSAHPGGVAVEFPRAGDYQFAQPFPWRTSLSLHGGAGKATRLHMAGSLFAPTGTPLISDLAIEGLYADTGSAAVPLFNLGAAQATYCSFVDSDLDAQAVGSSIWSSNNPVNMFGIRFTRCNLDRAAVTGVPAINVVSNSVGVNDWKFTDCGMHSHLGTQPHTFFIYTGTQHGFPNLVWNNILGEQNKDGMLNLQGVTNPSIEKIIDWDCGAYTAPLIRIGATPAGQGGFASNGALVDMVGTPQLGDPFSGTTGLGHVKIVGGVNHRVGWVYQGPTNPGTVNVPTGSRTWG